MKVQFKYNMDVANPASSRSLPLDIPGLRQDLDADFGIGLTLLSARTWADQSGQGNHATAAAAAVGLVYTAEDAQFSNHASVTFNGVNDIYSMDGLSSTVSGTAKPFYYVQILRHITLPGAGTPTLWGFTNSASGTPFYIFRTQTTNVYTVRQHDDATGNVTVNSSAAANTTASHIVEIASNGTTVDVRFDGTLITNAGALGAGAMTVNKASLGGTVPAGFPNTGAYANYKLTRNLVYNNIPSAADQLWLRQYLKARYQTA